MFLKTIQASAFKNIFEVLKDILNDVNVSFNKKGVHMITLDNARTAMVELLLDSEQFEEYSCDNEIIVGINTTNVFRVLKSVSAQDVLVMEIKDDHLLTISIENTSKKSRSNFKLKLLDINEEIFNTPDLPLVSITPFQTMEFQRLCRDISHIGSELTIERTFKKISFRCKGDFAEQYTEYDIDSDSEKFKGMKDTFSLKYLNLFTKATSMCANMKILHHGKDMPLVLEYKVTSLGDLKFYLAPKSDD
jgi:proliferating cell nuclear antigen